MTVNAPILDAALAYLRRGWIPVPMKLTGTDKKPVAKYKHFKAQPPTEDQVREMFALPGVNGVAVMPASSGLAIRDFDDEGAYERWAAQNPVLAQSLPTVQTKRGKHVWFSSDLRAILKLADGEYRGDGITVAPPSMRDGFQYGWIIPLPSVPLPFVESRAFVGESGAESTVPSERAESAEQSESAEREKAIGCAFSALSVQSAKSPDEIIALTIPTKPGERNGCILKLARGLKFNAGLADADVDTLRQIVRKWYSQALPTISTRDFDETWADFRHAFEHARHPLGTNLVDIAALRVDPADLPAVAANYDGEATKRLIGLCFQLSEISNAGGRFFLSSHDAGQRIGLSAPDTWRRLRMLERDGVIQCLERGHERRATRYKWIGGDQ